MSSRFVNFMSATRSSDARKATSTTAAPARAGAPSKVSSSSATGRSGTIVSNAQPTPALPGRHHVPSQPVSNLHKPAQRTAVPPAQQPKGRLLGQAAARRANSSAVGPASACGSDQSFLSTSSAAAPAPRTSQASAALPKPAPNLALLAAREQRQNAENQSETLNITTHDQSFDAHDFDVSVRPDRNRVSNISQVSIDSLAMPSPPQTTAFMKASMTALNPSSPADRMSNESPAMLGTPPKTPLLRARSARVAQTIPTGMAASYSNQDSDGNSPDSVPSGPHDMESPDWTFSSPTVVPMIMPGQFSIVDARNVASNLDLDMSPLQVQSVVVLRPESLDTETRSAVRSDNAVVDTVPSEEISTGGSSEDETVSGAVAVWTIEDPTVTMRLPCLPAAVPDPVKPKGVLAPTGTDLNMTVFADVVESDDEQDEKPTVETRTRFELGSFPVMFRTGKGSEQITSLYRLLEETDGPLTIDSLCTKLEFTRERVALLVDVLHSRKLVVRMRSAGGREAFRLV
ncbi:hypothetical protein CAOG_00198 [Capsaspora owczarzaki ATCC 30864]|uniref:Uncharacterized protein n=1 Tax=Capsaspora owczarzaki (strain ATCC 30864) TaxID=595528 RepID=A0A0D2VFP2_CAPO3|nr:hypothetical protein CAOG_00198 [Capsaspora owczarzaki ATCC 30864]KJE88557.1 hypothetical protein, variant 1 [Capsaspora owczarzaki ATCC 30864]|eukprot:XP_004365069.1 hypothetical protein CAOG_00198 [Capsaspora owczarzaki ATCC 30864]